MSGNFRAEISISKQLDELGNRLNELNMLGVEHCTGMSLNNNITIKASTRKALENKIKVIQANMLAFGFMPIMFTIRRWKVSESTGAWTLIT